MFLKDPHILDQDFALFFGHSLWLKTEFNCCYLVVPPDINDTESSTDTTVREGSSVNITCLANGHPQPHILWRREDGAAIGHGKQKGQSTFLYTEFDPSSYVCVQNDYQASDSFDTVLLHSLLLFPMWMNYHMPLLIWNAYNNHIILLW